jgi:DnaA-like protein
MFYENIPRTRLWMLIEPADAETNPLRRTSAQAKPRVVCLTIAVCVAHDFGIDPQPLFARGRGAPRLAQARQIAMYVAHVGFALSCESVARQFRRDRSTVAHACRVVEDGRDDRWFDCRVGALEVICRSAMLEASFVLGTDGAAR